MKIKHLLPLLLVAISFNSCIERTETIHQETVAPAFSVEEETLNNRISAIIPFKQINFSSTKTKKSGEAEFSTLNVEILTDTLPSNGFSFSKRADDVKKAVVSGIENIADYQKMKIEILSTTSENGTEHRRSYTKEIDL